MNQESSQLSQTIGQGINKLNGTVIKLYVPPTQMTSNGPIFNGTGQS